MFKNLKDKLATQVNKTNQTLFSAILPTDSISTGNDSGIRTSSITSHDENNDNNRSRLNSASSDISQTASGNNSYVSPTRHFMPPSDIESEHGGDESDYEMNSKMKRTLTIYKNKFEQLKNAYNEVEREREHIKNTLQKQQDNFIKRQTEMREFIKAERHAKEELENSFKEEIKLRDTKIQEITQQLTVQTKQVQNDQEEIRNLREKTTKLETLLHQCKETIKTHQEKTAKIIIERDDLLQKLNEKQAFIENMIKDRETENSSGEVREQADLDISLLTKDKARLQEELESARLNIQRLETDFESMKQEFNSKMNSAEQIRTEHDTYKQNYEDLLVKFNEKSAQYEQSMTEKLNLTKLNKELEDIIKNNQETMTKDQQLIEQQRKDFVDLKTQYENLLNESNQEKEKSEDINEIKANLIKLQNDYNEVLANCTKKLDTQKDEHLKEILSIKNQQQMQFDNNLKELIEENDCLKIQIENLKIQYENTNTENLNSVKNELTTAENKIKDLLKEINQYEDKLKENSLEIVQLKNDFDLFKSQSEIKLNDENQNLHKTVDELKSTIKHNEEISRELQSEINEKTDQLLSYKIKFDEQEARIQQQTEQYSQLESKFNTILSEKLNLETELNLLRDKIQTIESSSDDHNIKFQQAEQRIKELQTECASYENEVSTLKSEIVSLMNINEENTRRMDQYESEKFELEQDIIEKDRQLIERNEKIQEIELSLKQTQDRSTKLREALQKVKTSTKPNEQNLLDIQMQKLSEDYEQRLKEKEIEYNTKLKAMAKEMSTKLEENEYSFNQQICELMHKNTKAENDTIISAEKKASDAENRAYLAEMQLSKLQEQIKEKQLENHRHVQDLLNQIQKLTKQIVPTADNFSQTSYEDIYPNTSNDDSHVLLFEPTEIDYLKQIVLAYMTGTDPLTMAKVICAVLRYNDNEKSLIIEHEKLRHSRWINTTR